ncbi:MAG TPA: Tad domain-containing protein [Marmoricola sp.]|nr:Tad domain-containing protein [Marmoricola sp.]
MSRTHRRPGSRRDEQGFVAVVVAVFMSGLFFVLAAISVDVARWYMEVERVQKAADAGALAGVTHMPQDLAAARATASDVSSRNGYPNSGTTSVAVEAGTLPSQLKVAVSSTIPNTFGSMFGIDTIDITRTAVADYNGPAPMGSPCNTFGNEPTSGVGSATPVGSALPAVPYDGCSSKPDFWASIEGPQTTKGQGDRYATRSCGASSHECSSGKNKEYREDGYFWLVRVGEAAVGNPIKLQLYDPGYVATGQLCQDLPKAQILRNDLNPFVNTDGTLRYAAPHTQADTATQLAGLEFCTGDFAPDGGNYTPMTTTFVLRDPIDTKDPNAAPVHQGCVRQYGGLKKVQSNETLDIHSSGSYEPHLAQFFHTWSDFCTFTPTRAGDYYLQVRSNVSIGGTTSDNNGYDPLVYEDNPAASARNGNTSTGAGQNSFGIRAVTAPGLEDDVAVSGYARMPIFANAVSAQSTFNLIRVLPAAAGKSIRFSFFDVGDCTVLTGGSCTGSVQVLVPNDATGSIATKPFRDGCRSFGGASAAAGAAGQLLTSCSASVNYNTNNGKLQTVSIPIPNDYMCNYASFGGCWYKVKVSYPNALVNDITTWDADIAGDPVRLIE